MSILSEPEPGGVAVVLWGRTGPAYVCQQQGKPSCIDGLSERVGYKVFYLSSAAELPRVPPGVIPCPGFCKRPQR